MSEKKFSTRKSTVRTVQSEIFEVIRPDTVRTVSGQSVFVTFDDRFEKNQFFAKKRKLKEKI